MLTFSPQYTTFGNQFYLEPIYSDNNTTSLINSMDSSMNFLSSSSNLEERKIIDYERTACTIEQSQFKSGNDNSPSSSSSNSDICRMTAIATFLNTLNIQMPFFAVILFYSNLIFLLLFLIFFFIGLFQSKEQFGDYKPMSEEEKLDEDSD